MKFQNVRGTNDYYNSEMQLRQRINEVLRKNFTRYGFGEASTPILNEMDLLAWKYAGGSEILKEVYGLKDQGERALGLRYDLTVPFAKMISFDQNLKMPFRRFEIGRVFRDGPVKAGRLREFIQADVDIVGIESVYAELEFFKMIKEVFSELDIRIKVEYNDRSLLYAVLQISGIETRLYNKVILILDKALKIEKEDLLKALDEIDVNQEKSELLLSLLERSYDELVTLIEEKVSDETILEAVKRFNKLRLLMEECSLTDIMTLNIGLARGLEVYTGTIWEVFALESNVTSSIAAGGRYDKLISSFINNGRDYPTVGMTFGVDVIYTVLKAYLKDEKWQEIYYLIPFTGYEMDTMLLAEKLRAEGNAVIMEMRGIRIGKAMNYANRAKYKYVVVVGEGEVNSGTIRVKDMESGEETAKSIDFLQN